MAARSQAEHHGASDGGGPASARIDVWLWSVRQGKSRPAAPRARKAGHGRGDQLRRRASVLTQV